jgi:2-polyprenyl-6-methoxyphenol hydroxylase-like FAD-dependent oxidoreductase
MHELGILDEFLKQPHNLAREIHVNIGGTEIALADFTHLPTHYKFIVFMPQWDFLNFIVGQTKHLPNFHLQMESEVTELIQNGGRIVGVKAKTPTGELEVRANLIVGADGRSSTVRAQAGLEVINLGAPMDVLWMRLSRRAGDPAQSLGRVNTGAILIMLDRGDYWQCGFVIRKGAFDEIKQDGLPAFQERLAKFAPVLRDRVGELNDWNKIRLLTVNVDRLRRWHLPGLLCIGHSAHAMSPIGGIGINLAIQDAVAAANILAEPLRTGTADEKHSCKIQKRRELPTRLTQGLQLLIQNRVINRVLKSDKPISPPTFLKLFQRWPFLRRIPARIMGIGFRPEHIKTAAYFEPK